jgi:hypothetical protein
MGSAERVTHEETRNESRGRSADEVTRDESYGQVDVTVGDIHHPTGSQCGATGATVVWFSAKDDNHRMNETADRG